MKARLDQVQTGSAPIERFRPLLDRDVWSALNGALAEVAHRMRNRVLWNVNSTARGGGVAELLGSLIPYDRGAGIDERWVVMEGSPNFFKVTKKIHDMLHGVASDGARLSAEEQHQYELATANNAGRLVELIHPGDVVILHDPQTMGLIPSLTERGAHVVWRSHIGVDTPNDIVRGAWKFLRPYLDTAGAYVFSRASYVWEGLEAARVRVIAPCIDPFSAKNADLDEVSVHAILHAAGVVNGASGVHTPRRDARSRLAAGGHDGACAARRLAHRRAGLPLGPPQGSGRGPRRIRRARRANEPSLARACRSRGDVG